MTKPSPTRVDAIAAMHRAEASSAVADKVSRAPAQSRVDHIQRVPHNSVFPSQLQPRVTFDDIDQLAESILATGGVLQALLVRAVDVDGSRYEIVDGERRWRAMGALLRDGRIMDSNIPVRILDVKSDAIAGALAHIANAERKKLTAFELAQSYRRLQTVLTEAGENGSSRAMASYVGHRHASIASYVRIAEEITDDLMVAAGVVGPSGEADRARVSGLGLSTLRKVLSVSAAERAQVLQAACEAAAEPTRRKLLPAPGLVSRGATFEEQVQLVANRDRMAIRWRGPAHDIPVGNAEDLLRCELLPAAVAIARRIAVVSTATPVISEVHGGCAVLVMPTAPELMPPQAAAEALKQLGALQARIREATRPARKRA